ncbi:polycystic kidney disease 2-like 1 protein isoform X1 [Mizuhopecten yessoensis]|uniref:Polycystin-2 n=1 Tax=Mizuhopecten yessoensis TaxID=6573 RepID=A0A210Q0X6_MIZYE|nr:polycystic kidney disease 2-like 1 protein isoform X1 [Mizuhopecten yessoensis]XP_021370124.1 polycystic kidney disease 2-like 1 protein isoform X1 [Mizuhopecten yessoensis]XP_021370125.1 polycystic kidney disease 2-like 1 protein isoform X1 [Mizuhopecten yessoensis]OWF42403.1 Polycystin-2 [Mizuhopecten yessoensis]
MPKERPTSAQSRTAWIDDMDTYGSGGHARPDSQFEFRAREDADLPMENEFGQKPGSRSDRGKEQTQVARPKPVGIFGKIGRGIRSLWATRQTEETKGNRELHVKTTLRELIIYIVFLVILCVVTFGMTSTKMYYYTKVMSDLFLSTTHSGGGTFQTLTNVDDFWKFSRETLLKGLYWEKWYNGDDITNPDDLGYIYYENKLLGIPRFRQLKVSSNSCVVHEDFKDVIRHCYDSYSDNLEDKTSTTADHPGYTAWTYKTEEELDGSSHWGQLTTYSGAGYVQELVGNNYTSAKALVDHLFNERWIDRGTRAVFIDFTVYNANINLFCVVRFLVEFPATGGAIPSWTFRTVKLIRYVTVQDYFIMACECIFVLFIVYYIVEESLEIKKHKLSYFKNVWNILDILVILLAILCVAFDVYRTVEVDNKLSVLLENPDKFADFEFLSYWQTRFDNAIAIAVFLAWIKIFKYISFNKTMTQLSSTLGRCAKDLAGFAVMFFIIFLAFTQLGYLLFGTQVKDFSNFQNSFFTLFRIILGDFDFHQLEAANRVLGPIFFMLFVFFVFFVLINMFLAIINDTYSEVKGDMANQKNEFEMGDYFKRGYMKMVEKINFKRDKIVDIQEALKTADINQDHKLEFDEWRTDLKTRGYADSEIEALFAKYDVDGDRILDSAEQKRLTNDLEEQTTAINKEYDNLEKTGHRPGTARSGISENDDTGDESDDDESGTKSSRSGRASSGVSYEEFTVLSRRVDRMEHSIGSIVSKIDAVLVKLEAMEKAKLKRRETMGKILDSITESDGNSDEMKREQMEKLVREELERWDSETSFSPSGRGASPGSGNSSRGVRARSRPNSGNPVDFIYDRGYQSNV